MSATSIARKLALKAPVSTSFVSMRTVATRSKQFAAPSMATRPVINISKSTLPRKPASGWRKSIVMSTVEADEPESLDPMVCVAKQELAKLADGGELDLKVDMEELKRLAQQKCTPLSLKDMYKYAIDFNDQEQRLRNAQFLHKELPIRIAQRAVDLLTLPHGLSEALPIRQVAHVYLKYLEKFQETPVPTTAEEEDKFTDMLQTLVLDKTSIPMAIAQGVAAWRGNDRREGLEVERIQEMEEALYRFFTARVGLRFLTEHHILSSPSRSDFKALRNAQSFFHHEDEYFLGCIQTDCSPAREVRKVAAEITRQTKEYYGICPEIQIVDATHKDTNFTYVPHHLHYMVGELLKNSCRATVRRHLESELNGEKEELAPIRVVIVKGAEDVTIKIADKGGGIPRSKMATIWKFAHSTAGEDEKSWDFGVDETCGTKIRGFGLPLARIYARYLGGALTLKSMEGYGLDAYLHLPRLGDSCENLPARVTSSPGELDSTPQQRIKRDQMKYAATRSYSTMTKRETVNACGPGEELSLDVKTRRILDILKGRAL